MLAPKGVPVVVPRTYEFTTLCGRQDSVHAIKLRVVRGELILDCSSGNQRNHKGQMTEEGGRRAKEIWRQAQRLDDAMAGMEP